MSQFNSAIQCLDDLETRFSIVSQELITIFSGTDIRPYKKRVEEIVMQFDPHAQYYADLSSKGKIGNIRMGVLHVCGAFAGRFSNTFFMYPPGKLGIESEVERLQEEITSLKLEIGKK